MIRYVLDTNACVASLRGNVHVATRITNHASGELCIPSVAVAELYYGAWKSAAPQVNLTLLKQFLPHFTLLEHFQNPSCAFSYGMKYCDIHQHGVTDESLLN